VSDAGKQGDGRHPPSQMTERPNDQMTRLTTTTTHPPVDYLWGPITSPPASRCGRRNGAMTPPFCRKGVWVCGVLSRGCVGADHHQMMTAHNDQARKGGGGAGAVVRRGGPQFLALSARARRPPFSSQTKFGHHPPPTTDPPSSTDFARPV